MISFDETGDSFVETPREAGNLRNESGLHDLCFF